MAPSTAKGGRGKGGRGAGCKSCHGGLVGRRVRDGREKKEIKEMHMAAGPSDKGAGTEDKQMRPRRAGRRWWWRGGGGGAVIT